MSDTLLFERLDELVDDCASALGDWNDVRRRARSAGESSASRRRPRRPSRRILAWAVVVASLLVILFATPAFGLLRNWIGRKDVPFDGKSAPYRVKRDFADLSIGAPKRWDPQVIASESREVAVVRVFGKGQALYVAPTRNGGFCWTFANGSGSCLNSRPRAKGYPIERGAVNPHLLWVGTEMRRIVPPPGTRYTLAASGIVLAKNAASLRVEFQDHTSAQIPFVYVSKPIDAGFFYYGIPRRHYRDGTRLTAVSAFDSSGKLVARVPIPVPESRRPPRPSSVVPPPTLPRRPLLKPKPPLQRGRVNGVSVVAGKNGVAVIDTSQASERVREFTKSGTFWACFSFMRYHEADPAGVGALLPRGQTRDSSAIYGIPTPFDGCQVQGMYGDNWPDRLRSHSVVEIALTARGKKYFAERAAAADLALFVRTLRVRGIRSLSGEALDSAISREFGTEVAQLPSVASPLAPGNVGYAHRPEGATFVELSTTGRRFEVTIAKGKIVAENVRPLTILN